MAPDASSANGKNLDQEVRDLISSLTTRLQRSQKPGASSDDDDQGVRIITLAGTNLGATMRGDMDDKTAGSGLPQAQQPEDPASYVVNSNFQAINNSIMVGGSYKTNDPGVHLDITEDYVKDQGEAAPRKKGRKSKRSGSHKSSDNHRSDKDTDDHDSERS